ncbi:hypothetical protein [Staphylococcus hominis]|uniref:hypothetical protein n=1 Tax=Staphylococcus hominis TaxID=1290 RepID=UPI00321B2D3B
MKKFLALIFSGALVLGACGNDDASNNNSDTKSENKTEKKSEDKKDNKSKDDKKSKEEKKSQESEDNKSTQESVTNDQVQSQQQTQQPVTQEQQQTQQANNGQQQSDNHEPTKEEIYEWDKQNIPGGTDYGLIDPEDVNIESEDNTRQNRIDEINQEMEDPNISDSDYNKLVEEYNELNNE